MENRKLGAEENKYVLEQVNKWIDSADNKVGVSIGLMSAVLAVIAIIADNFFKDLTVPVNADMRLLYLFYIATLLSILLYIISIGFYISTVIPRLNGSTKKKKSEKKYSIYFDEIGKFESAQDYVESTKEIDIEGFIDEIAKEIYYNSSICSRKMKAFRIGTLISGGSIVFALAATVLYYCYTIGV